MTENLKISVVIAIKDWDPSRLELAIRSHMNSSIADDIEIVISDFGSTDPESNKAVCDQYGCVYVYTDADVWSRSQALNVGLSSSSSNLMLTTDADIIFAPRTLEATVEFLTKNPRSLVLNQCSDLSKELSMEDVSDLPWEKIRADATLRPRWGMGGLCAFTRDTLETVRGFEERMTVWGAEDNDFVKRCRQAGRFLHWISGPDVGIYHVWHPPFMQTDPNAIAIFESNKKILVNDTTTARNYTGPVYFNPQRPLVSVHIAAFNRAHLIGDAIKSVLEQTVQDFELLIYDDGSTDNTRDVVSSFDDSRIRYINDNANGGVANARNRMLDEARGQFVCVHDDDDIMLPNRLELQLDAMTGGYAGNYGGWIDYDACSGKINRNPGKKPFGVPSTAFVGSVLLHPTLMIRTDVMRRLRYETSFRGGSDYNLAFRIANAGYKLNHCGDYVILRRVHNESLTGQSQDKQKLSARITVSPFLNNVSKQVETALREEGKKVKSVNILPFYDDHALSDFMPDDLFDQLVDITDLENEIAAPVATFYSPEAAPKKFAIIKRNSNPALLPRTIPASSFCRVPKLVFDSCQEEDIERNISSVSRTLCSHLDVSTADNLVVLDCPDEISGDIQSVLNNHAHLVDALIVLDWENKSYIAVDASTVPVARFLLRNMRMILCSDGKPASDHCETAEVITLEVQS